MPTNWASAEAFLEALDNTDTTGAKGKYFLGIGNIDEPADVTVPLGRAHEHIALRKWSLNFAPEIGYSAQYAFLQSLQRSRRNFRFWFATMGGRLIGGPQGIRPEFVTAKAVYGGGNDDLEAGRIVLRWSACVEAPRSNAGAEIFNIGVPSSFSTETGGVMGNLKVITQTFYDQAGDTLIFTENGGTIPADSMVGVYHNGQKLLPVQYVRTGNTFVIDSNTHYPGDNYEVVIIILE